MRTSPVRWLAPLVVLAVLGTGCGEDATATSPTLAYEETIPAAEHMQVWGRAIMTGAEDQADPSGAPGSAAATLRAEMDSLLRGHVITVLLACRALVEEREERFEAAEPVAHEHLRSMVEQVAVTYDEELAREFEDLWRSEVEQYYRYATAEAVGDEQTKQFAFEELETVFVPDLADLLVDATGGLLAEDTVEELATGHVETMTAAIRQFDTEPENWMQALATAVEEAATFAAEVAVGVARDRRLAGDASSTAAELRAELTGAMEDTVWYQTLVGMARSGDDDRGIREAALTELEKTTGRLAEAFRELLGDRAGRQVADLWARHNDLLAELALVITDGSPEGRERLLDELSTWAEELGTVLEETSDGSLSASAMASEAGTHVDTMVAVFEAWAGGAGS